MIPKERSKAMNKERRKRLIEISDKLSDLLDDLEEVIEEEEEAFNNPLESLPKGIVIMNYHTYKKTQRQKNRKKRNQI